MKPRVYLSWLAALVVLFAGVGDVHSKLAHRHRLADDALDEKLADERVIDLAVHLRVVVADPAGEELIHGAPKLRIVRTHNFGGRFDTLIKRFVGMALKPIVLYCSLEQEPAVLHEEGPEAVWMQGGMGSGKTRTGCVWSTLQVIKHAEHRIEAAGITSPVGRRMEFIRNNLLGAKNENGKRNGGIWPRNWFSWREGDQVAVMRTGLTINFVPAHIANAAEGSPLQGYTWGWSFNDELQDYHEADEDIQMRGRGAWQGRYERFATLTPKRSGAYRVFRDRIAANDNWQVYKVTGPSNPFLPPEYWEKRRGSMPLSSFLRKVMGEDPPPDNAVYTEWLRILPDGSPANLRPLPHAQIPRWPDVTRRELAPYGGDFDMLVGFDPGRIWDVSVLLKAFQPPAPKPTTRDPRPAVPPPVWFVVGEVSTKRKITETHCRALLKVLRDKWGLNLGNGAQALVRGDPTTKTGTDEEQPDKNVYDTFRAFGIHIKPAVYRPGSVEHGRVPKNARIDLINTLLCDDTGERRLFVECGFDGAPVAPKLVESLEQQELDHDGKAEMGPKDESDLTHWACAVGYALWSIESKRIRDRRAA